jgi:hypothetical protein
VVAVVLAVRAVRVVLVAARTRMGTLVAAWRWLVSDLRFGFECESTE